MSRDISETGIPRDRYDALVFDLDGVVTRTAKVHASAWKQLFDEYLEKRAEREGNSFKPFDTTEDYGEYVDGKPRYEGVKSFLESRNIEVPYGDPDDPPDWETICGLGNKKTRLFHEHLKRQGVEIYEPAVHLIRTAREQGLKTAVVSSSKNCKAVLDTAGLADLFDIRVDGMDSERLGLKGKPEPHVLVEAARRLGVDPARAVAFEDAEAGVKSARRAGFGLVIGVDRVGHAKALSENGAHVVVEGMSRVAIHPGDTPGRSLPSALDSLKEIEQRIQGHRTVVFLDYDGTLTPIVDDPEKALLPESMRNALIDLATRCTVAVISGRDLKDVREKVGIRNLVYAGSHGFDIGGPEEMNIRSQKGEEFLPLLDTAEERLRKQLGAVSGLLVERKKFSVAVHYRKVKGDRVEKVGKAVDEVIDDQPRLRKSSGKKVFEIQPGIDWHKGKALLWLMKEMGLAGGDVSPFYIGDDTTDEDAFRALPERGTGIVVMERPRPTAAHYMLKDPGEVEQFIRNLSEIMKRDIALAG